MHKTTFLFAGVCVILVAAIIGVLWLLRVSKESIPLPGGSSIALGILPPKPTPSSDTTIQAKSALLYSTETDQILFQRSAFERRPLASITKLMTAMVAIDHGIPWEKEATILPQEYGVGGELILAPGESVTMRDLVAASLIGSANNATRAYVRELNIPEEQFIQEMNRKAIALGLEQTEFTDVTGLDPSNISTAYEIALLAHHAFTEYPDISRITSAREYTFTVRGSNREHTMHNTNKLVLDGTLDVLGSKTGFLYEAGYCLVVEGSGQYAHRVAVVMDSPSESAHFLDIERLLKMHAK
jgi:D-alanyl-D-alanine carboxypeptidase